MKKKNIVIVLLLMMVVFTTGCARKNVSGKGSIKDFSYESDNFSEIEISDIYLKDGNNTYGPKVNIFPGAEKKIIISMDENFENEIKVKKDGNKKIIQGKKFHNLVTDQFDINLYGYVLSDIDLSGACEGTVSSECLDKNDMDIELSGACTLTVDIYSGVDLHCELSGASTIGIGECKATNTEFDLSGASTINMPNLKTTTLDLHLSGASHCDLLLGSTNTFSAELSGASEVIASNFEIKTGNVHLSGASLMSIKVNQSLTGEASGASTINYSGEGNVQVSLTGGSSVNKQN